MQPPHPQTSTPTTAAVTTATTTAVAATVQEVCEEETNIKSGSTVQGKVDTLATGAKGHSTDKSMPMFRKIRLPVRQDSGLTTAEAQQVRTQPGTDTFSDTLADYNMLAATASSVTDDTLRQSIPFDRLPAQAQTDQQSNQPDVPTSTFNIDLATATQHQNYIISAGKFVPLAYPGPTLPPPPPQPTTPPLPPVTQSFEVSQNTAICDRPKAKPVSKKEGKTLRKLFNLQQHQLELQQLTKEYQQLQMESMGQTQQTEQTQQVQQQQQQLLQQQPTLLQQLQEGVFNRLRLERDGVNFC